MADFSQQYFVNDAGRPHVAQAIDVNIRRYQQGENFSSNDVPPRCGKSAIIQGTAYELGLIGAPFVVTAVPWDLLGDQMCDVGKISEVVGYYVKDHLPHRFEVARIEHLRDSAFYRRIGGKGRYDLQVATVGLLLANKTQFLDAIDSALEESGGRRPVLVPDEAQLFGQQRPWANFLHEVSSRGCYIVPLTGTARRRDSKPIPGFEVDYENDWEQSEGRLTKRRVDSDGRVRWYDQTLRINSRDGTVRADFRLPWDKAFENNWLNGATVVWISDNVEIKQGPNEQPELKEIRDLDKKTVRPLLREISEQESTTNKAARSLVTRLCDWRITLPTTKALVVTGSDDLGGDGTQGAPATGGLDKRNKQARRLKSAILTYADAAGLKVRVEIATSVTGTGEPDKSASTKIAAFRGDREAIDKIGIIDILIVKVMGLVGLDVPELKILLNLSAVRDAPLILQIYTRPLTRWPDSKGRQSELILIEDAFNREVIDTLRAYGCKIHEKNSDVLEETEIEPPGPKEDEALLHDQASISGYADHRGGKFSGDREDILHAIKSKFYFGNLSDVEILANYEKGAYSNITVEDVVQEREMEDTVAVNLTSVVAKLRGKFQAKAKRYVNNMYSYGQNAEAWTDALRSLQYSAKVRAGVNIPVDTIDDPDLLQRCINALDDAYEAARSQRNI